MPRKSIKKEHKKVRREVKKVERRVERKMGKGLAKIQYNNAEPPLAQLADEESRKEGRRIALGVVYPEKVSDLRAPSLEPNATTSITTKTVFTFVSAGESRMVVYTNSTEVLARVYEGASTIIATGSDPGWNSISGLSAYGRVVARSVKVSNVTPALNMSTRFACGNYRAINQAYGLTYGQIAAMNNSGIGTLTPDKPSCRNVLIKTGNTDDNFDVLFPGTPTVAKTTMFFGFLGPATNQIYQVEVISHYEILPTEASSTFIESKVCIAGMDDYTRAMANVVPQVITDSEVVHDPDLADDEFDEVAENVLGGVSEGLAGMFTGNAKALAGGAKKAIGSLVGGAKNLISKGASWLGGAIGSLFGDAHRPMMFAISFSDKEYKALDALNLPTKVMDAFTTIKNAKMSLETFHTPDSLFVEQLKLLKLLLMSMGKFSMKTM